MMVFLAVLIVIVAWLVVGRTIWKWGPGLRKRPVLCPNKKLFADVLAEQREAEFGCLRTTDVKACSLFGHMPLNCGKECLTQL